jgi:hypothetical protein
MKPGILDHNNKKRDKKIPTQQGSKIGIGKSLVCSLRIKDIIGASELLNYHQFEENQSKARYHGIIVTPSNSRLL